MIVYNILICVDCSLSIKKLTLHTTDKPVCIHPPLPCFSPPRTEFPLGKRSGTVKCNRKIENKKNTTPEKKILTILSMEYCGCAQLWKYTLANSAIEGKNQ